MSKKLPKKTTMFLTYSFWIGVSEFSNRFVATKSRFLIENLFQSSVFHKKNQAFLISHRSNALISSLAK